jgi:uncharacterized membrane protein (DUF106 family)
MLLAPFLVILSSPTSVTTNLFGQLLSTAQIQVSPLIPIDLQNTFLVLLEAIGVNLLYAVGRRKFTDIDKMKRYNSEMKAFREEMSAATKSGDKVKIERLKKKQQQMSKMQAEMSMQNLKPTLLFMVPLMGVYYLVSSFIKGAILAVSPIVIPLLITTIPIQLSFFWWYMICSFTFSGIISRLFGLTMD